MSNKDKKFATDQEAFWAGDFGDDYIARNKGNEIIANKTNFFARALRSTQGISLLLEMGANTGLNLIAIKRLFPKLLATAVEINEKAVKQLAELDFVEAHLSSIQGFTSDKTFDLILCCGVLIHINPEQLSDIYQKIFSLSHRYILIAEYYNPTPIAIAYRGNADKLFKRDFAGEMLDAFPTLVLKDYGFVYHRDNIHPLDDITWFLLEKTP